MLLVERYLGGFGVFCLEYLQLRMKPSLTQWKECLLPIGPSLETAETTNGIDQRDNSRGWRIRLIFCSVVATETIWSSLWDQISFKKTLLNCIFPRVIDLVCFAFGISKQGNLVTWSCCLTFKNGALSRSKMEKTAATSRNLTSKVAYQQNLYNSPRSPWFWLVKTQFLGVFA